MLGVETKPARFFGSHWNRLLGGIVEQIAIALTGVVAIWLSQDKREGWRRYACLFGLAGQPFWFYSAWSAEQWGIFVLCIFYTWAWFKGFRNHWLQRAALAS